jgi:hypothetical protein
MFAAKRCGTVDAVKQSVKCCGGEEERGQRERRLRIVSDGMVLHGSGRGKSSTCKEQS